MVPYFVVKNWAAVPDSFADSRTKYRDGVMVSVEYIYPASEVAWNRFFHAGQGAPCADDSDLDGEMDCGINYADIGDVQLVDPL